MTRITAVKKTKKGHCAIFSEDGFLFSVNEQLAAEKGLYEDAQFSDEELCAIRAAAETRKAIDAAYRCLAVRAHGETELYRKLLARFDAYSAAAAVAELRGLSVLDDAAFALEKAAVMAKKGKSPFEIRQSLRSLGISGEVAGMAVAQQHIDGAAAAAGIIEKRYAEKLAAGQRERVAAALARRGFSRSEIVRAIELANIHSPLREDDGV